MKLNKVITAIICLGAFSFSGVSFAEQSKNKDQSQELSNILTGSNQDSGFDNVKKKINEKYPIIQKVSPNFKVSYLEIANIYEIDLGDQKAYTNKEVSYLYLKGQVFVSKDGEMLNLTQNPKDFIKNEVKSTNVNNDKQENIKGSYSKNSPIDTMKVDEDQKIHTSLNSDLYLNSLSKSNDISLLKKSAMLEYVGVEGYSSLPQNSADYVKELDLSNAVKLVYGNGKRVMIIFADPDCPYCQNFENTLTENSDKIDVTAYILPWAIDIHKDAPMKIKFIWSQKDPSVAWKSWMTFAYLNPELVKEDTAWNKWVEITGRKMGEKSTAPTEIANAFIEKYGLKYSPTIVFPNGEASEGDITVEKLIPYLSISEKIKK